jgi:hypothetical protein
MIWTPVVFGGFYGFGTGALFRRDLDGAIKGAVAGVTVQLARQLGLIAFEQWAQRQLLFQLWRFQGTYLYSILANTANISKIVTTTGGAVVAGAALGSVVGSAGAVVLEEVGIISEKQKYDAIGFYTIGQTGNKPNYWNTDENNSGYFNVPKNIGVIYDHYFGEGLTGLGLNVDALPFIKS